MAPTMPPFFLLGRVIVPSWKKENMLERHILGNSRPSMLVFSNFEFSNFLECALDAIQSLELTLRLEVAIKGWRMTGSVVPLVILVSLVEKEN